MVLALCSLGQQRKKGGSIDSIWVSKILIGTNTKKFWRIGRIILLKIKGKYPVQFSRWGTECCIFGSDAGKVSDIRKWTLAKPQPPYYAGGQLPGILHTWPRGTSCPHHACHVSRTRCKQTASSAFIILYSDIKRREIGSFLLPGEIRFSYVVG